jgi:creatinine amidohydrolase/Fe(II)-dependent formamide hydrolase-like protein
MKLESLIFQDRFDTLLEMRLSSVAEQEYTMLYGKSRLELLIDDWQFKNIIIVNGHGAENQISVIKNLQKEFTKTGKIKVVLVMPMLNYPEHKWSHAAKEETQTLMAYNPESVDLSTLPSKGTPLVNKEWAIVDDQSFRGRANTESTVEPEEDPRTSDPKTGQEFFAKTIQQLKELILQEIKS